jgi:hypothetical protein
MKYKEWDSDVLGIPVYELEHKDALPTGDEYTYAKISPYDIKRIQYLGSYGFSLCGVSIEYFLDLKDSHRLPTTGVRRHVGYDIDTILAITDDSFYLDRFHNDPNLSEEQADNLYRNWVLNACNGSYGDAVFVACDRDGVLLGFSTCRLSGRTGIIDLTAIDLNNISSSAGYDLIANDINFFIDSGMNFVRTTTQVNNIPSRRSLERFGFKEFGVTAVMSKGVSRV